MNKRNIILGVCAADLLAAVIMLIFIAEKPVSSMSVIMPAMGIVFYALLIRQKRAGLKSAECLLPTACGLLLSAEYVFLEYRIYDTALADIFPFSNVIKGQCGNILFGAVMSMVLFLIEFLAKKQTDNR